MKGPGQVDEYQPMGGNLHKENAHHFLERDAPI